MRRYDQGRQRVLWYEPRTISWTSPWYSTVHELPVSKVVYHYTPDCRL